MKQADENANRKQGSTSVSNSERGSLALEQVLFIGAVVTMSVGLYSFYNDLGTYFSNFSTAAPPTNVGSNSASNN
jgi:hypothetical protein